MLWGVLKRWWWLAVVLVATSACEATFDVAIQVNEDGSGVVETTTTINAAAADAILDLERDADGIVLADLAQSGWVIERPDVAPDGTTVIMATKEFGTPEQLTEVLDELDGPEGPFRDISLVRTKSFARVDYELTGALDSTAGLAGFSDPALERALGESLDEMARRYDASSDQIRFSIQASLPGELQGEQPDRLLTTPDGRVAARWQADLSDGRVEPIALSSATSNVSPVVLVGLAVVLGVIALLVLLAEILRILLPDRRRSRRRSNRPKPPAPTEETPERVEPITGQVPVVAADGTVDSPFKVVALDLMGVLYRPADHVGELLMPFVRERTTVAITPEELTARMRSLTQGRITTDQFWPAVGVKGNPSAIDAEYVAAHQLAPGVVRYLRALRDSGVRVAVIANYATGWAQALRTAHNLDGLIDTWVISGNVGVVLPEPGIFEVLRRVTGTDPAEIQIIDDDLATLDAARQLGYATSWFTADGDRALAGDHAVLRSFGVVDEEPPEASEPSS